MRAKRAALVFFLSGMLLGFMACSVSDHAESLYIELPQNGWAYKDTLAFYPAYNRVRSASVTVAVDHSPLYKYNNLWLEISTIDERDSIVRDTLQIFLCDSTGNWTGTGIASNYQTVSHPVEMNLNSNPMYLRHIMRTDTLRYINRIGVFFSPD